MNPYNLINCGSWFLKLTWVNDSILHLKINILMFKLTFKNILSVEQCSYKQKCPWNTIRTIKIIIQFIQF